ncbi:MAG TPA: hypothetical protein VKB37_00215 [Jatrophihabitantaceae bacterium]|nr:hypothetical protein [Jatrophihabitantaceae bacterium]
MNSQPRADRHGERSQPALGLFGLLLVVPIATALAIGAGGDGSTFVIGPIVTYSLAPRGDGRVLVGRLAGHPGAQRPVRVGGHRPDRSRRDRADRGRAGRCRPPGSGRDLRPDAGPGHVPMFPATLPLGGTAFVAMLELTLVGEGWPLRRLPRIPAGLLAVLISWALALAVYGRLAGVDTPPGSDVIVRYGPVRGAVLGEVLVVIGAWQVLCHVV